MCQHAGNRRNPHTRVSPAGQIFVNFFPQFCKILGAFLICVFASNFAYGACDVVFKNVDNDTEFSETNIDWCIFSIDGMRCKKGNDYIIHQGSLSPEKVNSVPISGIDGANRERSREIYFKCDKWDNGKYIAYGCKDNYRNGTVIGKGFVVKNSDVYDACVNGCRLCFEELCYGSIKEMQWVYENLNDGQSTGVWVSLTTTDEDVTDRNDLTLDKLTSAFDTKSKTEIPVNNMSMPDREVAESVVFKCDKWENGEYFGYECADGYKGGTQLNDYDNRQYYDKCVAQGQEADVIGSQNSYNEAGNQKQIQNAQAVWKTFTDWVDNGKSAWRTKDGDFNKARLISDATASVVLGTVGGVVSSKIIKKKQIEKGFDVLHCTVGGQTVADWGDEFTIGLGK